MKILLFSDGTGNSSAKLFRTNVWRLYDALDLSRGEQVAFYDNGVGTSSFAPFALLGGALGWGLRRNVLDLYMFLSRNYAAGNQGDGRTLTPHQIYAFGFSRGAFTIRVLLGLLQRQGIVPYDSDERELARRARCAYRAYRAEANPTGALARPLRWIQNVVQKARDRVLRKKPYRADGNYHDFKIEFVGLWDTVAAYGLPVVELTRGWDKWIWPLTLPLGRKRRVSDKVKKACHALALDDERQTFHPLLWNEEGEPDRTSIRDEVVSQVWFAGMHSNVGGGYSDDGMAYDSLCWIAQQATSIEHPIVLKSNALAEWKQRRTTSSPMADSRKGAGAYYRYLPRLVEAIADDRNNSVKIERVKIHESVFKRTRSGVAGYAPLVLPKSYAVVDDDGNIHALPERDRAPIGPCVENAETAAQRHARQEEAWDLVWLRRVNYFLTICCTLLVLAMPSITRDSADPVFSWPLPTLSGVIALLGSVVPSALSPLIQHYQDYPVQLIAFGALLLTLMKVSRDLQRSIDDRMRNVWRRPSAMPQRRNPALTMVRRVRTSNGYQETVRWFRHVGAPNGFGILMLVTMLAAVTMTAVRLSVDVVPTLAGKVCRDAPTSQAVMGISWQRIEAFDTTRVCQPMARLLERNATYEIEMKPMTVWQDGQGDSSRTVGDFAGFSSRDLSPRFFLRLPLRRHFRLNWFVPIARVGEKGDQFFPLDNLREIEESGHTVQASRTTITPQVSGQLFLYVNDAAWWSTSNPYYASNAGTAEVRVRRLR